MAAVGLTWAEAKKRCPEGVRPACHNAEDTVTISGDAIAVNKFVQELKEEGTFAKAGGSCISHAWFFNEILLDTGISYFRHITRELYSEHHHNVAT